MDFEAIKARAAFYRADMIKFLRAMTKFPGESCGEREKIECAAEEMRRLGFDRVEIDGMGNLLGSMGNGKALIAFDGHIDTVGVGNRDN